MPQLNTLVLSIEEKCSIGMIEKRRKYFADAGIFYDRKDFEVDNKRLIAAFARIFYQIKVLNDYNLSLASFRFSGVDYKRNNQIERWWCRNKTDEELRDNFKTVKRLWKLHPMYTEFMF